MVLLLFIHRLSYDVVSGIEITPCIKVDKPQVVYRFSGNFMKSITTLSTTLSTASLAMSKSSLKALPGKLDIKRHSPTIHYLCKFILILESSHLFRAKIRLSLTVSGQAILNLLLIDLNIEF